ncbi:MAG: sirohydrochlorin cobaltochelatase [Bacteroidales bacterium]|nr:sirohydrochlorin cobaltochelatase [Bacteroidales bacterium]
MKRFLTALLMLVATLPAVSQEKTAILMAHFGTSYDDTRALTIDAVNAAVRDAFPGVEVRETWTSRVIVRKLAARGVEKLLPVDALLKLRADGYKRVIVQSTTLLEGAEMASLRRDVASVAPFFEKIIVGEPLLCSVEECAKVADIMLQRHGSRTDIRKKAHLILVGHGTHAPNNATYSQMEHLLQRRGSALFHVATVEGYPTLATLTADLKAAKARKVTLVPFLLVAGEHAVRDISGEWKTALEAEGLQVETVLEGLGQLPEIQSIFVSRIQTLVSRLK